MKVEEVKEGTRLVLHSSQVQGFYHDPELGLSAHTAVPGTYTVLRIDGKGMTARVFIKSDHPKAVEFETSMNNIAAAIGPWSDPLTRLLASYRIDGEGADSRKYHRLIMPVEGNEWGIDLWVWEGNKHMPYFNVSGNPARLPPNYLEVLDAKAVECNLKKLWVAPSHSLTFSDEMKTHVLHLHATGAGNADQIAAATGVPVPFIQQWVKDADKAWWTKAGFPDYIK